jgi:hypothetical protein
LTSRRCDLAGGDFFDIVTARPVDLDGAVALGSPSG